MSVFGGHFSARFSACDDCTLKSTTAWLLKLSVLYIHSFMHVHNTTFEAKTVFNNVLFSTEVYNLLALHVHLLDWRIFKVHMSYIYILLHCHRQNDFCIKMGSDESHFIKKKKCFINCEGQSHKTVSTDHHYHYQPNALPLGQTSSYHSFAHRGDFICLTDWFWIGVAHYHNFTWCKVNVTSCVYIHSVRLRTMAKSNTVILIV